MICPLRIWLRQNYMSVDKVKVAVLQSIFSSTGIELPLNVSRSGMFLSVQPCCERVTIKKLEKR